ncbi:MAG: DUF2279 domain-containing protein [Bacteroidia bacterium]
MQSVKLLILPFIISLNAISQNDSLRFFEKDNTFNATRFYITTGGIVAGTSTSLIMLNELWYKGYPRSSFHTFNDNDEWLLMDKIGHATTAYTVGYVGHNVLQWSGVEDKKALWYGGTMGLVYLTGIEMLDGFSAQWGFSIGDMAANISGSAMYIGQELLWKEQRFHLKFSAHLSAYAQYRPNVLGSSFNERLLKDYNGQTYWLSANIASFLGNDTHFPKWLNLAFGYSGEEMLKGDEPLYTVFDGKEFIVFNAYRQYFLSLDVDLSKIKSKSRFLNTVLGTINYLKIPFPAVEFSKHGLQGKLFYF